MPETCVLPVVGAGVEPDEAEPDGAVAVSGTGFSSISAATSLSVGSSREETKAPSSMSSISLAKVSSERRLHRSLRASLLSGSIPIIPGGLSASAKPPVTVESAVAVVGLGVASADEAAGPVGIGKLVVSGAMVGDGSSPISRT